MSDGSAAVHAQYLAGDVGGAVGSQERAGVRHVFRCTEAAQSDLLYARVYLAPVTEIQLVEALGPHDAWVPPPQRAIKREAVWIMSITASTFTENMRSMSDLTIIPSFLLEMMAALFTTQSMRPSDL